MAKVEQKGVLFCEVQRALGLFPATSSSDHTSSPFTEQSILPSRLRLSRWLLGLLRRQLEEQSFYALEGDIEEVLLPALTDGEEVAVRVPFGVVEDPASQVVDPLRDPDPSGSSPHPP